MSQISELERIRRRCENARKWIIDSQQSDSWIIQSEYAQMVKHLSGLHSVHRFPMWTTRASYRCINHRTFMGIELRPLKNNSCLIIFILTLFSETAYRCLLCWYDVDSYMYSAQVHIACRCLWIESVGSPWMNMIFWMNRNPRCKFKWYCRKIWRRQRAQSKCLMQNMFHTDIIYNHWFTKDFNCNAVTDSHLNFMRFCVVSIASDRESERNGELQWQNARGRSCCT